MTRRDSLAAGDVVRETELLAEEDRASKLSFAHVKRAVHKTLLAMTDPGASRNSSQFVMSPAAPRRLGSQIVTADVL